SQSGRAGSQPGPCSLEAKKIEDSLRALVADAEAELAANLLLPEEIFNAEALVPRRPLVVGPKRANVPKAKHGRNCVVAKAAAKRPANHQRAFVWPAPVQRRPGGADRSPATQRRIVSGCPRRR